MLALHISSVSNLYTDYISDMICQLHHLHLEQDYIQQKHDQNCQHLCYHYCVSTSADIYLSGKGKYPTLHVS